MILFPIAHAAGVIDDAPTLGTALLRVLDTLLFLFGFLVILASVIVGVLYFFAAGDARRAGMAKKAFFNVLTGAVIGLAALLLVRQLATLLQ